MPCTILGAGDINQNPCPAGAYARSKGNKSIQVNKTPRILGDSKSHVKNKAGLKVAILNMAGQGRPC